jgi:hypothetical protein
MLTLPNWLNRFRKQTTGGGGGGALTFLRSANQAGTGGSPTSITVDSTGSGPMFLLVSYSSLTHPAITDALGGNTWNLDVDANNNKISIFSCLNPSNTNSSHTLSIANVNNTYLTFLKFTGSTTMAFQAGSTGGTTGNWNGGTVRAGSLTPSGANNLFLAVAWWDVGAGGAGDTIDSSFTKLYAFGTNPGMGVGYKIKSSDSSAENPGWVHTGAADGVFMQATYTP